jgi:hypothetical protein
MSVNVFREVQEWFDHINGVESIRCLILFSHCRGIGKTTFLRNHSKRVAPDSHITVREVPITDIYSTDYKIILWDDPIPKFLMSNSFRKMISKDNNFNIYRCSKIKIVREHALSFAVATNDYELFKYAESLPSLFKSVVVDVYLGPPWTIPFPRIDLRLGQICIMLRDLAQLCNQRGQYHACLSVLGKLNIIMPEVRYFDVIIKCLTYYLGLNDENKYTHYCTL